MVSVRDNACTREKAICCHIYNGLPLQRYKSRQRNQKQIINVIPKQPEYSYLQNGIFQQLAKGAALEISFLLLFN